MQHHVLSAGTILDGRYQIESVLGEGGFGITYLAINQRIDLKVAIKELFWRDHSARDAAVSPEIALLEAADADIFDKQKKRFLHEARTIRDFSDQSDVAHILDYFEANNTAYIVMEYVQGETLSSWLQSHGTFQPEELLRALLPLIQSLAYIHKSGIIHRDISPDNIIVQPDGRLKLIDFGAAHEYAISANEKYTTITKDSYAPSEQYDKNGKQGPWTDVYSLCATAYACLTGMPPLSAVQRMFLDELKPPRELRPDLEEKYEAILLRGLQLSSHDRYQTMDDLAKDVLKALPDEKPRKSISWKLCLAMVAALICVTVATGFYFHNKYKDDSIFKGITTETFYLKAPSGMSVQNFSKAQRTLQEAMDDFAGSDNYILTVSGSEFHVELPLDLFEGRDIGNVLDDVLPASVMDEGFRLTYQIQVNWEDPSVSMFPGKNQILPGEFSDITAIFSYSQYEEATLGQRANILVDFKTRLDALNTPYSIGTAYGNEDEIIFRLDPTRIGRFVSETIRDVYPLQISGEGTFDVTLNRSSSVLEIIENGDGSFGLRCTISGYSAERLQKLTEAMLNNNQHTLYLESSDSIAVAEIEIDAPVTDGVLEFQKFRFESLETIDEEHRYILDYIVSLIRDTELPLSCYQLGEGIWNAERDGDLLFDVSVDDYLGLKVSHKANETLLREALIEIDENTPYDCSYSNNIYWIKMHFNLDGQLMSNIETAIPQLLDDYALSSLDIDSTINILLIDEIYEERFRISLHTSYDYDQQEIYHHLDYLISKDGKFDLYVDDFLAWWDSFPAEEYGFEKAFRW